MKQKYSVGRLASQTMLNVWLRRQLKILKMTRWCCQNMFTLGTVEHLVLSENSTWLNPFDGNNKPKSTVSYCFLCTSSKAVKNKKIIIFSQLNRGLTVKLQCTTHLWYLDLFFQLDINQGYLGSENLTWASTSFRVNYRLPIRHFLD